MRAVVPLFFVLAASVACNDLRALRRKNVDAHPVTEHRVREAGHETEHGPSPASLERLLEEQAAATDELREQRAELAEAIAREREVYKGVLAKEIALVQRRVRELESEAMRATGGAREAKSAAVAAAKRFRQRLEKDLDEIERTGEDDWPALRDRIDRDLEEERPVAVPRAYEKSFAI